MIYAIYIAAAAVIGLLIGLVSLSILWLRRTVLQNIRSRTVGLISVYDELLEEKSKRLNGTEKCEKDAPVDTQVPVTEIGLPVQTTAAPLRASQWLDMAERSGGAVYRDRAIGGIYLKIRRNFTFRLSEILPLLADAAQTANDGPAGRLLKELKHDTVYRLSTLPPEEQEKILRDVLPADGVCLLDGYLQTHSPFGALGFYDHLRFLEAAESKAACLRVPCGVVPGKIEYGGMTIIPDGEICEGFQVEENRILYDYCIKARELS